MRRHSRGVTVQGYFHALPDAELHLLGCSIEVSGAAVPFDVALLDLLLPDSNDLTVAQYLRRVAPHTQIILMTALTTAEIEREAIAAGVYRVVRKPFEIGEVATLVLEAHESRGRGGVRRAGSPDARTRSGRHPRDGWGRR